MLLNNKKFKRIIPLTLLLLCLLVFCGCGKEASGGDSEDKQEKPDISAMEFCHQTREEYIFMEGSAEENLITVIRSEAPGPAVFIVGGVHGNETAGWTAANELKDELEINCGTVYILSPVNKSGAAANKRQLSQGGDLNRAFPGDAASSKIEERVAAALFAEIEEVSPDLVLDLHEAVLELGEGDNNVGLGNTVIYTLEEPLSDLLFDFLAANQAGELCGREYALTTPGVEKSFNRVVSDQLEIPVITVETWRALDIEVRVKEQKDIVVFCLNHIGMMSRIKN